MDHYFIPNQHPDPHVDLTRAYVTQVVVALVAAGVRVRESWLDPRCPRDATVRYGDDAALVWDEETGWRRGRFVSGRQEVRTVLAGAVHLGGCALPAPDDVVHRVTEGVTAPWRMYRRWTDLDRFDDELRAYEAARLLVAA
jgi:Family of unknown function (DUF6292)